MNISAHSIENQLREIRKNTAKELALFETIGQDFSQELIEEHFFKEAKRYIALKRSHAQQNDIQSCIEHILSLGVLVRAKREMESTAKTDGGDD